MVEINRYITTSLATLMVALSVNAQQIKPRIDGLESNNRYMTLLAEDMDITKQEDSIAMAVGELRVLLRDYPDSVEQNRNKIISSENRLFELRARKASVVDSLNLIEQNWVLSNAIATQAKEDIEAEGPKSIMVVDTLSNIHYIYQSDNVLLNLSKADYQNLVKAEQMEQETESYCNDYIINCQNLLSLKSSYQATESANEASTIKSCFDALKSSNIKLLENLNNNWGYIYDNKSYAYSLLMEVLGCSDVLERESEMMRKAQADISALQGSGGSDEILRYRVQKSSMVAYEALVAKALNLRNVSDSLTTLHRRLSALEPTVAKEAEIEERLFIEYEPAIFNDETIYNKSNPIPETKIYDKGLIFRIFLGSFSEKQSPSIFRKTSPISYEVTDNDRYAYYAGGYTTLAEAEEAQAELKEHGFRKPQVVVWSNGKSRNLALEPLEVTNTYRIFIEEAASLPNGVLDIVNEAGSSISKIGNDNYVITPLSRESQVDSLVQSIKALEPNIKLKSEVIEGEFEF